MLVIRRGGWWLVGALAMALPGANLVCTGYLLDGMARVAADEPWPAPPRRPRELGATFRLGLLGALAASSWLAGPGLLIYVGWCLAWAMSYENIMSWVGTGALLGHAMIVVGALMLIPTLTYLPAAQMSFASTRRLASHYRWAEIRRSVQRAPFRWWLASCAIPLVGIVHLPLKALLVGWPPERPFVVSVGVNGVMLAVAMAARWTWGRCERRARTQEPRELPPVARLVLLFCRTAVGVTSTAVLLGTIFVATFGLWDALFFPMVTVPAVPYPGGYFVTPLPP